MRRVSAVLPCIPVLVLATAHSKAVQAVQPRQELSSATLQVDAQYGGDVRTVETDGEIIAVGAGPRLVLLDGTTDGDPPQLAASAPLPGNVTAIAFSDHTVVAAYGRRYEGDPHGLALFDKDATGTAAIVGRLELDALPVAMWVRESVVHVAAQVQTPVASPRVTATPIDLGVDIRSMAPARTTEFSSGVLLTLDISEPESPRLLDKQPIANVPVAYEGVGDRAYLLAAGPADGRRMPPVLTVMDVTDGAAPRPLGSLTLGGSLLRGGDRLEGGLAIGEEHAYVGVGDISPGLVVVDIRDPTALAALFEVQMLGHVVALLGRHLYASDIMDTLVLDVTDPAKPEPRGRFSGFILDFASHDDRLIVAESVFEAGLPTIGNRAGVGILRIGDDPLRPEPIGRWTSLVDVTSVAAGDEQVHATVGSTLLVSVQSTSATPPRHLGSFAWEESGWSLSATESAVGEGFVAMTETGSSPAGLSVAALAPSGAARTVTTLDLDAMSTSIAASGPWIAVITEPMMRWGGGPSAGPEETSLRLFDAREPTAPVPAGSFDLVYRPTALAMRDGIAYVAAGEELLIFNVSAPPTLEIVKRVADIQVQDGYGRRMFLSARHLAIATTTGLRLFDVRDPIAPVEVGSVHVDALDEIALSDDWLYVLVDEGVRKGIVQAYPTASLGSHAPARLELPSAALTMAVTGDHLVVVTEESGLYWLRAEGDAGDGGDGGIERPWTFQIWLPSLANGTEE